jgi:putative aldouronate transport system permease protein
MMEKKTPSSGKTSWRAPIARIIRKEWSLYLLVLPTVIYFIIFAYVPMYGAQIAFKNFVPTLGISGSKWVGFAHFQRFLNSPYFFEILRNVLVLSLYSLALFPLPIIFAMMLNYQRNLRFKKFVQTVSYAPHFISVVVAMGMLQIFTSPVNGIFNKLLGFIGAGPVHFMAEPALFPHLYVLSGVWQGLGWSAIIYIGALASISPELHEAATVDGASVMQRIRHIDIPGIMPTVTIMLILAIGGILGVGFEKVYLMQNNLNSSTSEVIATYVYKAGLVRREYSFSAAVGLFNSVVNFVLLVLANQISRKLSETSLF